MIALTSSHSLKSVFCNMKSKFTLYCPFFKFQMCRLSVSLFTTVSILLMILGTVTSSPAALVDSDDGLIYYPAENGLVSQIWESSDTPEYRIPVEYKRNFIRIGKRSAMPIEKRNFIRIGRWPLCDMVSASVVHIRHAHTLCTFNCGTTWHGKWFVEFLWIWFLFLHFQIEIHSV